MIGPLGVVSRSVIGPLPRPERACENGHIAARQNFFRAGRLIMSDASVAGAGPVQSQIGPMLVSQSVEARFACQRLISCIGQTFW